MKNQLVVGSKLYKKRKDWRERLPNATGVDMLAGDGVDLVMDLEIDQLPLNHFEYVECIKWEELYYDVNGAKKDTIQKIRQDIDVLPKCEVKGVGIKRA